MYKQGIKFRDKWEFERFALDFDELFNSFDVNAMKLKEYREIHSLDESVIHAKEELFYKPKQEEILKKTLVWIQILQQAKTL